MLINASIARQVFEEKGESGLPAMSLLTFSPVGNELDGLTAVQRQFFFNSMMRMLYLQSAENEERVRALAPRLLQPAMGMLAASRARQGKKSAIGRQEKAALQHEQYLAEAQSELERIRAGATRAARQGAAQREASAGAQAFSPALQFGAMPVQGAAAKAWLPLIDSVGLAKIGEGIEKYKSEKLYGVVFKERAQQVLKTQEELAAILNDYARGDAHKAEEVLAEFSRRASLPECKSEDLAAVLLLVIEDEIWSGEEGDVGGARPGGAANKVRAAIPEKVMQTASESAEIRLASVREMLRYYFLRHPADYRGALALALGLSEADAANDELVRAKLTAAIAELGAFAMAQKLLAAIKEKRKMDTKKCLLELGYKYDAKSRKLVVGKRTCGKPAEAKGIIAVLLSKYKKPNGS